MFDNLHATLRRTHLRRFSGASLLAVFATLSLAACSDDPLITVPEGPLDVSLNFAAEINGAPFACGTSYAGVGTTGVTITPADFRMYVSSVELLDASGEAFELELDQDSPWQHENLALLDFENGSGSCVNGTAATRTVVEGTVPAGDYTGVRFVLGVPFELNHIDQTTAPAPLDITGLFWSWNGGYKFMRFDHVSDEQPAGWFVHLGSTGCSPTGPTNPATSCANPHRVTVEFRGFDYESQVIVADVGRLLAGSDVSRNTPSTAKGCMSFPNDADCPAVMNRLGLSYGSSAAGSQVLFSVR